jgi:hypothetical protein
MKLRIALMTLVILGVCSTVSMQPTKKDLTSKSAFGGGGLPPPCLGPSDASQGFPCVFTK